MASESGKRQITFCFAITILLSSFLIFQVQPLISKYILPWFGGTPGVWSTCMLFFQVVLFAGYAYAHLIIQHLRPTAQCVVHITLMGLALLLLPIAPDAGWKPTGAETPTWRILGLLAMNVGLPYFMLSATGPLLQAWYSRVSPGSSPYRLYALSNIGSVAGLVTYPFVFEPAMSVEGQAALWSWAFVSYALGCAVCAAWAWRAGRSADAPATEVAAEVATVAADQPAPTWGVRWAWFLLATCASVMLLATTNQVCLDVAVVPFLWVLPLSLYLVSFILCFDHERWYPRRIFAVGLFGSMMWLTYLLTNIAGVSLLTQIIAHFTALFLCCMVCHGELVRLKPSPRYLTSFYLASSAGGATGGILVGLVAPLVFDRYLELHLAIGACCVVSLYVFFTDRNGFLYQGRPRWAWACLLLCCLVVGQTLRTDANQNRHGDLEESRNFYGVLRIAVEETRLPEDRLMILFHGRILHGGQFIHQSKRRIPTTYYGEQSGVGLALRHVPHAAEAGRRVGVVGLGAGTLAAYGEAGDTFRIYEINSEVIRMAKQHFTYLRDCPATVQTVLGDARLSMEREEPQNYDLLALDAFSSDAIPTHLLTREAFGIYLKHLQPKGVMAIHITNKHFDLVPVVASVAEEFGLKMAAIKSKRNVERWQSPAYWMLLSRDPALFEVAEVKAALGPVDILSRRVPVWTDNYSNLVGVLKSKARPKL